MKSRSDGEAVVLCLKYGEDIRAHPGVERELRIILSYHWWPCWKTDFNDPSVC